MGGVRRLGGVDSRVVVPVVVIRSDIHARHFLELRLLTVLLLVKVPPALAVLPLLVKFRVGEGRPCGRALLPPRLRAR